MALHTSEAVQCQCCEEYSRLGELADVVLAENEIVMAFEIDDENDERFDDGFGSRFVGKCPHCMENIYTRNIC